MPSVPSDTCAALKTSGCISGEHSSTSPSSNKRQPRDLRSQRAKANAGAMRASADCARDALHVDVTQIFLRQPMRQERVAQCFELGAAPDRCRLPIRVNRDDTLQVIQRYQHAVCLHERREGMARADHAHRAPALCCAFYQLHRSSNELGLAICCGVACTEPDQLLQWKDDCFAISCLPLLMASFGNL